jgi:hypothetical protein
MIDEQFRAPAAALTAQQREPGQVLVHCLLHSFGEFELSVT